MKKILLFFFAISSAVGFSQNSIESPIVWNGVTENENRFIALMNLKDKNSLIVRVAYSSYWHKGFSEQYIIYQKDGKIKRFHIFRPTDLDLKTKIKRKRVRKKDYEKYWAYLNHCIAAKKFQIDKSQLNTTRKPGKEKGTELVTHVSDGATYHFGVYQGHHYIAYASYTPTSFIKNEFPGYLERQKLVDLMTGFESLIEKN